MTLQRIIEALLMIRFFESSAEFRSSESLSFSFQRMLTSILRAIMTRSFYRGNNLRVSQAVEWQVDQISRIDIFLEAIRLILGFISL